MVVQVSEVFVDNGLEMDKIVDNKVQISEAFN